MVLAYVTKSGRAENISVIDTKTHSVVSTVTVGINPLFYCSWNFPFCYCLI
ncbi:hypothetical protein [Cytobacillus sp. IB215665]|uniref:hypothetical protein n=1 Tax=Cytobacillus sp. IB215665 TaxID=3097357 RepID=UPI0039B78498